MKLKTFILTFLMMSCSIVFGQGTETASVTTEAQLWMHLNDDEIGTISLANDIKITATCQIPNGKKVTIDLNGHKLFTEEEIYIINNEGKLTITDNSEGKTGTISSTLGIYNGVTPTRTSVTDVKYDRVLTINGGVFNSSSTNGNAATIYNYRGVIKINGGEFYGEHSAITNYGMATIANAYIECLNRDNGAAAIINDFEIAYGENVNIVGIYTTVTGTAYTTGTKPTYLFAELKNGPKYPSLQAALDACTTGDNTINLLFHNSDNATVSQKEGVNITIVGNGYKNKQFEYTGTIYVNGNNRYTGNETLTIQNVNFTTNEADHDFISANVAKEYAHNLTVKDCDFTATGAGEYTAVAMRFRQAYNIKVEGGRFTKLHSVMWATGGGGNGITVEDIVAEFCKNGVSFGTSTPVAVKNSTIDAEIYAVRADGSGAYNLTVGNSTLKAEVPVIVRNTTGEYNLTVENNATLASTNGGPQVVVTAGKDDEAYVTPTSDVNVTLYDNVTSTFGLTAKIGNAFYATLQDAVDNAIDGDVVTLIADVTEDEVLITQKADVDVTINGNNKTFTGHITIFGSGRHTGAETLTIKNVVFKAVNGKGECIASATNINGVNSYAHNVTIDNCSFKGNDTYSADNTFAIRFPSGGVGYDLTVTGCTADDKMFGLLWVTQVGGELIVDNCTAEGVKEGIVLTSTTKATITNTTIDASNVAIRAGQAGAADGTINEFTFNNNTLKSNDIAIQIRGNATDSKLSMEKNVVSGTTHISGNTAATKISADANYWDGKEAPVATTPVDVFSYYAELNADGTIKEESLKSNVVAKIGEAQYTSLQAAINAVKNGEKITLVSDITENVTLTEKVGLYYTIDGSDKTMNGSIIVNPLSDTNDNRRITISNINFVENTDTDVDFISAVKTNHYPRLTISGCDFTGSGNVGAVVAVRLKSSHSVVIENCTGTGLHSFLQNTAGWNLTIDNVKVNNAAEGGFALGTVQGVTVKNCEINGGRYGIRLDGQYNNNAVIESNKINAYIPVIARRATFENVNFTFSGENVMEQTNDDEVWFVIDGDDSKYHEGNVSLEDIPAATGKVLVTLEDEESHVGIHGLVAKIDNVCYSSLQDAIDAATAVNSTITLLADVTEDVTIIQKEGVNVVIDGAKDAENKYTFTGLMSVDGNARQNGAETLTIKNINFVAKEGANACITAAKGSANYCYSHNLTVENCTFTDPDGVVDCAAIRQPSGIGGGCVNWTVKNCSVDETMHSLMNTSNINNLVVKDCIIDKSKSGLNLNNSDNVTLEGNNFDVQTYALRAGENGGTPAANKYVLKNNTMKSACDGGDAVIIFRNTASAADFSMTQNVVSGATHISGHTKDTQLSVDANYWDGQSAPVVAEGSPSIVVNSYYADEACTQLVRNEMGSICAFVQSDRITGDVTTNAGQSLVINIIGKDGHVIGTTSCEKPELMTGFNNPLTWRINFGADDSGSWAMTWNEGNPSVNNMPEKVELYVDGDKVAEADVNYTANGDGASPVFAVRTDNNGKILGSIANTGKYNLYDVAASFNNSIENDVNTGETIELIANVSATETIWISKSITINGNENSVTSNANRIFRVNASNIKVTLNDVKMVSTAEREGTNDVRGISIDPELSNIELTLNNSSVDFTPDSANDWSYAVNVSGNGTGHKVTVNSGTYEGANVINVHGANNKVVVKDAVLTSLYPNNDKYYGACIWVLQNQDSSVEATGNTFNGSNTVAFNLGTGTELVESDNTDNTTCMVAKIGDTYYTSVEAAINAAADGATVQLLERVIDETIAPWTGNPQHNLEKSITIQGYSNFGTILTGGMYLGYDDSQCREHNIVVKGVEFTGKGLTVACQQNVTIEGNKFNNITEGRAIAVIGKNVNSVITNNVIDGVTTSNPGIELRNTLSATVKGNTISNTGHNALQITSQVGATNSSIVVENNTLSNWGTADNSNGEKEGRAMRINGIVTAQINGNVMSHTAAPEEFVKITGTTAENIDASKNYWNGDNPFGTNMFLTDLTSDPAAMLKNYYTDVEKTNLVTINSSVAKIGDVYYTTFADALEAVEDGKTITLTGVEGSESGEIEYIKDIEFTITGEAPNYALPIVTFLNATVNISNAEILIPELDARQKATINVIDSKVYDAGSNSIAKSYYNGAINISGTSEVYMMQVTTMGYINISGTAKLHATWQTNVYGNGLITLNEGATFNTAGLNLIAKDYDGRDNTDADRVGKPAEIVVNGANFTVGKVYSASGADYSYNADKYGINVGTIEGKSAILTIENGGNVNIYTGDGKTANIGADGTVNIDASTFNVECRAENGTATLANNGTMNVTGEANLAAANVTGNGWFYMNGVTLDDDTKLLGAKVRFASGTNNIDGSTINDGFFQVGIGAYKGVDANVDTEDGVVVNVKNAVVGANGDTYAGWAGTGFYDTDAEKAAAMTNAKYVLNIENSIAEFGYLHISNDGELNVNGNATEQAWYNNSDYSFYAGEVIINGTATFDATDVLALYTKVSCDNGTDNPGTLNIVNGTEYEAERHNGAVAGLNFDIRKTGIVNVAEGADLHVGEPASIAADATMNIGGTATVLGELTNDGTINFTSETATLTVPTTGLTVNNETGNNDIKVVYENGAYKFIDKHYVAEIVGGAKYESLAEAATAAQDGETIQLLWNEGDAAIAMNASFFGKNVTITGDAKVDWSKDWFFVGRGGEGNATVTFDGANLTSAKTDTNSGLGIHVSGREKNTDNKYDGTLVIKNDSNIELDYLIDRGTITIDNATLTVKNGFGIAGRPADETESGENATATISLKNGAKLIVYNHNGMGVGQAAIDPEGYGIMNIDATSTFETTQSFLVTANGTMNVNGGNVNIAGTLTNNGTMVVAAESNVEVTGNLNVNGTLNSAGNITANIVKAPTATIQLTGGIYTTEPQDGWCAENYGAFPYDENSWVVRQISGEQTFELTAGWNWVSSYITEFNDNGLAMLQVGLGTNGIQIKNNLKSSTYSNQTGQWNGSLTTTSVDEMYKVKVGELEGMESLQFKFEGSYVNYDERGIILYPGWNYIGYPVNIETNVADALVLLSADGQEEFNGPSVGDVLKSQQGAAIYFGIDNKPWMFDNQFNLIPGEGYMYHNTSGAVKILRYTTKNSSATTETNNRSSKYWTVDATQYSSNMTMIAMTDVEGDNYEVAAFVNGEVRGSSRPVYVESLDAYILILTISGDDVEEMTFRYYDITTGEEVEFSNRINYSSDAVVGSIAEPYMLTRGTTGIGEAEMSQVNIYPNPTTTGTEINLQATCDKVEVFNALGAKVAEYQNVDSIDALETAGIYVIRITNDSNVQNCKLVVR